MDGTEPEPEAGLLTPEAIGTAPVPIEEVETQRDAVKTTISTPSRISALQSFTDRALHFLSHASNETLGACLFGLGATTYFVLGRVGLVVIGVAGGVVLHATWEGIRGDNRDEATKSAELERRREAGIEVARRVLEWRSSKQQDERVAEDIRVYTNQALTYSSFGPDTEAALNAFTDAVIKDYVHYWYDPTLPGENSFPNACRRTFTAFMLSFSGNLNRKRPADAFMNFVTNASSMIIVFLQELSIALNASPNASAQEAISAYLKMKPDCHLAHILDQESQKVKLEACAEDILQSYLDPKSYNCPPVHVFLKEVLAQLILGYTVSHCSNPDWINDWIVYGLEESETTKEVMDMVDAGVEGRDSIVPRKEPDVRSTMEAGEEAQSAAAAHRRKMSRAEEAMDEAMREAKRLTDLMIEEDERRARGEQDNQATATPPSGRDSSDGATQGAPTPTSSQSDRDRNTDDTTYTSETASTLEETPPKSSTQFTSFDQIVSSRQPTALSESPTTERPVQKTAVLTLVNAKISIFDDSVPGERASIKAKPTTDYLIQIEPASTMFTGWMIARKYADFETLHEVLRRISVITGVRFTEANSELPKWRAHTKSSLRTELERYLGDAVRYQPLAESEGMKRFLEKDQGLTKSPGGSKGFGWPAPDAFNKFGGDMINVLSKAPKQVSGGVLGGTKAVFGGVSGLVGAAGKRPSQSQASMSRSTTNASLDMTANEAHRARPSMQAAGFMTDSYLGLVDVARASQESLRTLPQQFERRNSCHSVASFDSSQASKPLPAASSSRPESIMSQSESGLSIVTSPAASLAQLPEKDVAIDETINLPPPPSEMPADYAAPVSPSRKSTDGRSVGIEERVSEGTDANSEPLLTPAQPKKPAHRPKEPLQEAEASIAIELMFAVITQLYTLSGAWQIRRTLLGAAKAYLLRPGNPQLASIRDLLQTSLLDNNLSDSGMAYQIYKLRENTLPTVEELEIWARDYPERTDEQKEELRIKARRLLVTKGMPQALTSVMGAAASGDALGKVFDCLQLPDVSRGLIFGLMLQALRVVTH